MFPFSSSRVNVKPSCHFPSGVYKLGVLLAGLTLGINGVPLSRDAMGAGVPFSILATPAAGLTRGNVDGGWRFKAGEAASAPVQIVLGTFPAEAGRAYTVEFQLVGGPNTHAPVQVKTLWMNDEGKDAGEADKFLGHEDPTLVAVSPSGWKGETLQLRMAGKAATSNVKLAKLVVEIPALAKGGFVQISGVAVSEGIGQEEPSPKVAVDSSEIIRKGDAVLAKNLMPSGGLMETGKTDASRWRYEGVGTPHVEEGGYGGIGQCIVFEKDNEQGRWASPFSKINPGLPVWVGLWTKFNKTAALHGFPAPALVEFSKVGADGKIEAVPRRNSARLYFDEGEMLTDKYGQWFPVFYGPFEVPEGATQARVVLEYKDVRQFWEPAPRIANALPVRFSNFLMWQAPAGKVPREWTAAPLSYRTLFASAKQTPPPFFPVAKQRENSLVFFTIRGAEAGLFFAGKSNKPEVKVGVGNLLPITQEAVIKGQITDAEGAPAGKIFETVALGPYSIRELNLDIPAPAKFGAYMVHFQATVDGQSVGLGSSRFAWLRQTSTPEAVRHSDLYPFDMHPTFPADGDVHVDEASVDFEAGVLRRLGVRAVRQQCRYVGLNYNDPDASVAAARKKVDTWRTVVLPALHKHGIDLWVSLMEQGRGVLPKTPEELKVWHAYNVEQFKDFGKEPMFYLFGNEGMGGGIPEDRDVNTFKFQAADASERQWMAAYQSTYAALKEVEPGLLMGPSHSSDMSAKVARAFHDILGNKGQCDIWGYNCYGNTAAMGDHIHKTLAAEGYSPAFGVVPETGINAAFRGANRVAQEKKQASGLVQTYVTTLAGGWVKRIDWFIIRMGRGSVDLQNIFDADWTPRPAAAAYTVLADTLRAGRVEKHIALEGGGEFFVWRRTDKAVVGVGWAPEEKSITLDAGDVSEVEISDLFGNRQQRAVVKGRVNLTLTKDPVYVLGASSLNESKAFGLNIRNATQSSNGPDVVALEIQNHTKELQRVSVVNQSHPTVVVTPANMNLEIQPGESLAKTFQVKLLNRDDRRRAKVGFKVSNNDSLTLEVRATDTFARCVRAAVPPSFDGTWKGWEGAQTLHADQRTQVEEMGGGRWHGPDDLSAGIRTMWDDLYFYVGAEVTDDVFHARQSPKKIFLEDAIEIGFDLEHCLSNDAKLWQFAAGTSREGDVLMRFVPGPEQLIKPIMRKLTIKRIGNQGGKIIYQLAIPWTELGGFVPEAGRQISFGVIVDDGDGKPNDRKFISWFGSGISSKHPEELGDLIFVK